jgi:hypothetical protein
MRARDRRTPRPDGIPLGVREDDPAVKDDVRGTAQAGWRTQVGSEAVAVAGTPTTPISGRFRRCPPVSPNRADLRRPYSGGRGQTPFGTWGSSGHLVLTACLLRPIPAEKAPYGPKVRTVRITRLIRSFAHSLRYSQVLTRSSGQRAPSPHTLSAATGRRTPTLGSRPTVNWAPISNRSSSLNKSGLSNSSAT